MVRERTGLCIKAGEEELPVRERLCIKVGLSRESRRCCC